MLDEYYILVKRIKGMALSFNDFLDYDSFYMNYLLDKEKELIKHEQKEYQKMEMKSKNTNSKGTQTPLKVEDSPDAILAYEAYFKE